MSVTLQRKTITGDEPITLERAKAHLRVDFPDDDSLIAALISAARERAELVTGRTLIESSWVYCLDSFPYGYLSNSMPAPARVTPDKWLSAWATWQTIELPRAPLAGVDSVEYVPQADGAYAPLDPTRYVVDTTTEPGRIFPTLNTYWPITQAIPNAVRITYTAGAGDVPGPITQAMLLMIDSWYNNRTDGPEIPRAADALLSMYRVQPVGLRR